MRARAVPVALDRLRVERRGDAEVLGDAVEQPARHPHLVRHVERAQRADLELPLAGHDLGVDAREAEAGLEARVEVRLDDVTAEHLVGADAAVVEALRRREAVGREAERPAVLEERVLLLDAEQRLLVRVLLGDRPQQRPRCSWRAASCRSGAPRSSRARRRRPGSGPDTRTRASARSPSSSPAPGSCSSRRSPRWGARPRPRGPSSSTAAEPWARCRRSRCTPPCTPLLLLIVLGRARSRPPAPDAMWWRV